MFGWPAQRPKCFKKNCFKTSCFKKKRIVSRQTNRTLICLKSRALISATTPRYYFKIAIPFLLTKMTLVTFQAKMLHAFRPCHFILPCFWHNMLPRQTHYAFAMPPCFFPCSWHIMLLRQEYGVLQLISYVLGKKGKLLFTVTIHLSLFTGTVHSEILPKGGCPLYLGQVFCMLSSGLLP